MRTQVSVLLPVRNGATHLPAALRSLELQTHPPHQVVVVDDQSTDATAHILSAFSGRLPLHVVAGPGAGIARALNVGLPLCTSPWTARMDADDVMHPQRLAAQVHHVESHPDLGVCGTEVCSFPRRQVSPRRAAYDAWLSSLHTPEEHARDMFVEAPLAHPTALVRTHLLHQVGGYHGVPWPEDYDLWLRLHAAGVAFGKPPGVLHFWREHPARLSRTHADYEHRAIRACRLHHLCAHYKLRGRGVVVVGAGLEGKAAGRALHDMGVTVHAHVDVDPRKVGGVLHLEGGARVYGPDALPRLLERQPTPLAVVAIGTPGQRPMVRRELERWGLREGVDAVMAA